MKIGIISDEHLSIKDKELGNNIRAVNVYDSILWARELFQDKKCDIVIHCGDLTNSDILTAEENTLLSNIFSKKYTYEEYLLLGNHEMKSGDGKYNSLNILDRIDKLHIITDTYKINNIILEPFRKDNNYSNLYENIKDSNINTLISHSFYKGYNYEGYIYQEGIDYDIIKSSNIKCIFNGHIHYVQDNGIYHQVGNPTGLNFSDNYKYGYPGIIIFDTDTLQFERIVNDNAYLFIKLTKEQYKDNLLNILESLPKQLKYIRVECNSSDIDNIKYILDSNKERLNIKDYSLKILKDNSITPIQENKVELNIYNSPSKALNDFISIEEECPFDKEELLNYIKEYV